MDEIEWWEFETPAEMAEQVAGDIGFVIERAVEAHGGARIAVPGGQASELIYDALLANKSIDWSKVTLIPTDDRLVPLDDERSNYRKLEGYFAGRGAHIISLVDASSSSCFSVIDPAMDLDGPFSSLLGVSPRLA